jgi:predicted acetyltransferase
MEIRQLQLDEFEERMAISQFAFQFQLTADRMEDQRKAFRPEQEWGAFDEQGQLLSALLLIPLEIWVQGRRLAMGGIAGVATWPEARRLGCVSKLLVHSLETMRSKGQVVSMLHPFAFPFYRKFGWEMTVVRKKYTIETRQLPPRVHTTGQVKRMPKPDSDILDSIYTPYASRFSGMLVRTAEWWERNILSKPGVVAVYTSDVGVAEGYVFYEVANRKLTIHDMVSVSEVARQALWTYIGNHDSMIEEVILTVPIDDGLPFMLPDPRIKQEVIPYFMSRIVDAEAFVGLYEWLPGKQAEEVVIMLTDVHAPWNNGAFRLAWTKEGTARLTRLEAELEKSEVVEGVNGSEGQVSADAVEVTCDIQALTAMLLGNRKPADLREVGMIQGSEESIARLTRRIPSRTTHLMDFF